MKLKKQIPQCCRHRADEKPGKLGRGQVHATENPLYGHGDRALTVHFQKKMDLILVVVRLVMAVTTP